MYRVCLTAVMIIAPVVMLLGISGCADKVVTVQETEQRTESEPQMVSPGKMIVE